MLAARLSTTADALPRRAMSLFGHRPYVTAAMSQNLEPSIDLIYEDCGNCDFWPDGGLWVARDSVSGDPMMY